MSTVNYHQVFELAEQKGYHQEYQINLVDEDCPFVSAPDLYRLLHLTLLQKWLRDEKGISVLPEHGRMADESFGYFSRIFFVKSGASLKVFDYSNSYEEAVLFGIEAALKHI